jgi:mannose-6-phosphate isomerase-like protein (cupin superfamily)
MMTDASNPRGTRRALFTTMASAPTRDLGNGRGFSRMLTHDAGAANVDVHVNVIKVGTGPGPYHYHERCENVYVVLDGVLEVTVEGERRLLHRGDVAFFAPGVRHAAANGSTDVDTELLEIYAPPPPPGGDYHVVNEERTESRPH